MKCIFLFALVWLLSASAGAQEITIPELFEIVDMPPGRMDSLLRKKNYRAVEQEADSVSRVFYYTNLDRTEMGADWVRSVTLKEIKVERTVTRLLTYRTYRKKEYDERLKWLLENNFKTIKSENMGVYIHTIYDDGKRRLMVKQAKQRLPSGTQVWSYEFEMGK